MTGEAISSPVNMLKYALGLAKEALVSGPMRPEERLGREM